MKFFKIAISSINALCLCESSTYTWKYCVFCSGCAYCTIKINYLDQISRSFFGGSDGEESACNADGLVLNSESGRSPGEGNGNPLQYFCLENPDAQRSLVDYSPWSRKESDMTERLALMY